MSFRIQGVCRLCFVDVQSLNVTLLVTDALMIFISDQRKRRIEKILGLTSSLTSTSQQVAPSIKVLP